MSITHQYDVLVIGGGAAGLSLALRIADEYNATIAIITKGPSKEGSTYYAQGGVSAVLSDTDSFESHIADTLSVGGSLSKNETVKFTIEHGPENIRWMQQLGVPFSSETFKSGKRKLHLTREGGHTHRRVVHAADATGKAMSNTLENHARQHNNITFYEHHIAVDLITTEKQGYDDVTNSCIGAYVLNKKSNRVETFQARFVVLATGGASKVYLYTTNPDCSTGDGIAMAWRAGCSICNMEFNQFHPTCLYHPEAKSFLISEAVRGEGGKLLLPNGKQFMHKFDKRGELAPRDIVARAIDHEMKRLGVPCLYLDISHRSKAFIVSHFPTIYERCLKFGIDITKEPIPVVPAAHYTCGGVNTDLHGRTDISNLYAIGETAHTGLHGSNRLASNSLLECLVFAQAAAKDILSSINKPYQYRKISNWDESRVTDSDEEVVISHNWDELRRFMWDYVGIVRTNKRLERAMNRARLLQQEIDEYYNNFRITSDLIELRNLTLVAELIIHSAMLRKESRGLHFSLDYPVADEKSIAQDTILKPQKKSLDEKN
jgi:L-aspartate oxidase